jgi:secondary thiamine-phosphate synthase enzyme
MNWVQREFSLGGKPRGFHLVTGEVLSHLPEIGSYRIGVLHLFLRHTSASLTLNENADPTVRSDMERYFSSAVPERGGIRYDHDTEGDDDMPAHIKASMLGSSLSIPLTNGRPNLGTWQGVYLCEHRDRGGPRTIVATLCGEV